MIVFQKIKWCNFLSTGSQFTEIYLNKSPTTLIIGENGSGKSTILDALCFVLFGRPFRNINKPQLINSINQKKCVVEVEFSIGKKEYKIIRGIKPNTFEIYLNDELLNQDAASRDYQKYLEEHVLKLNYKSFTQIAILGSASFVPFMQLTTVNRREIIEDLLDIKIFSTMNDVLKSKIGDIKSKINTVENEIEVLKAKAKLQQEYIHKLEGDKKKRIEELQNEIKKAQENIIILNAQINEIQSEINALSETILDLDEVKKKKKNLENILQKLESKLEKLTNDIKFYDNHDECPTCSQSISDEFKNNAVKEYKAKKQEVTEAIKTCENELETVHLRLDEIIVVQQKITVLNQEILQKTSDINAVLSYISKLQREIDDLNAETGDLEEEKKKLKEIAKEIVAKSEEKGKLADEKYYLDVAGILLKDTGIKTKIIKQYLPVMNKIINKYLQAMDFFVTFELDEAFNETIKSRHRDEFSYASFSEGEKQRIDLALLFAWRTIAKTKNSTNTNLLILDEVFDSSLDTSGADLLYQILYTLDNKTNAFIISHRDALFDKFRSVIKFQKHNNFSNMVKN